VVLDEYADMRPSVWGTIVRPMLVDRQGWAIFIGTPKGHNDFYRMYQLAQSMPDSWYTQVLRASETDLDGTLVGEHPEELTAARSDMTQEEYEQEYECSFEAAILGSYFGRELSELERNGGVTNVPWDKNLTVETAWDIGKGANMAIWFFQMAADGVHIIDHLEGEHNQGLPQICEVLDRKPYRYGRDYVPHDAKAVDIGTGRTRVETLFRLGRKPYVVADHKRMDGINAARLTIPHCYFDRQRCALGIEALKQYRADYDEKTKAFKNEPRHDWTSHSADAFRYLAMTWRAIAKQAMPKEIEPMRGIGQITVDEFLQQVSPPSGRLRV
jgi:hypothetical protein